MLDICFQVLDNSKKALKNSLEDLSRRCDPVYISRTITAMVRSSSPQTSGELCRLTGPSPVSQVNANDDRGVLAGRWTEPFSDGVLPSRWTGSVPILRQWSGSGTRAVKYGQCWVFAGITCTGEARGQGCWGPAGAPGLSGVFVSWQCCAVWGSPPASSQTSTRPTTWTGTWRWTSC